MNELVNVAESPTDLKTMKGRCLFGSFKSKSEPKPNLQEAEGREGVCLQGNGHYVMNKRNKTITKSSTGTVCGISQGYKPLLICKVAALK